MNHKTSMTLAQYRVFAKDCDIGLWRPTTFYGRVIANATDGPYSHVNGILWGWNDELWELAYEEGRGGFAAPLTREVERHPGVIDVYRVTTTFDPVVVSERMTQLRHEYNWSYIRTIAWLNAPFVRWFAKSSEQVAKAAEHSAGGICSSHQAHSFAEDNVFFQQGKNLNQISPNDIYRAVNTKYIGTLI